MTELYPVYVLVLVHRNALIMAIILLKTRSVVLRGVAVGRIVCLQSRNITLTQSNMVLILMKSLLSSREFHKASFHEETY